MRLACVLGVLSTVLSSSTASAQFTEYCFGDGSTSIACPCGNHSPLGADVGCLNADGLGGKLRATGNPSLSDDGDGTASVRLDGTQMMPTSSYMYIQGTTRISVHFGDGLRCVGGAVIRMHPVLPPRANVGGASHFPEAAFADPSISVKGLVLSPGTRTYQCWYRDATPTFCTTSTFNLTNAVEITWGP